MISQIENKPCCIKHCWGVDKKNGIVNHIRADDWTAEWAIIAGSDVWFDIFSRLHFFTVIITYFKQ